jgi:hypothetical protein
VHGLLRRVASPEHARSGASEDGDDIGQAPSRGAVRDGRQQARTTTDDGNAFSFGAGQAGLTTGGPLRTTT